MLVTTPMNTPSHQSPALRWTCRLDLNKWIAAFRYYFPRKAHLAERVCARLSRVEHIDNLRGMLPALAARDTSTERDDKYFANRRLLMFAEDRLTLIQEFRILPDAADLFLTACPVGCSDCYIEGVMDSYYDQSLCYYADNQVPSRSIKALIDHQYTLAKGQTLQGALLTGRIGEYIPPRMIQSLFDFLRWDFRPDFEGQDQVHAGAYVIRIGWLDDNELGSVECFAMPITAYPVWSRDEVFWSTLMQLLNTRDLNMRPVLVLNNRPQQLVKGSRVFTSYGYIVMRSKVVPLYATGSGLSLADTVVEATTFNAKTSDSLLDLEHAALRNFWSGLKLTSKHEVPDHPSFRAMPDNWMLPA